MSTDDKKVNRPPADNFRQQKLKAWQPILTPFKVVAIFIAVGVAFIPTGIFLLGQSDAIYENIMTYDGSSPDVDCSITKQNQGKICQIKFTIDKDFSGPLYVYYQLTNFYQNHRRYVVTTESTLATTCVTSYKNGSLILNPCGLIANSFFTDIITLVPNKSNPSSMSMDESGISWPSDSSKFKQVTGFKSAVVKNNSTSCEAAGLPAGCKYYYDSSSSTAYRFYYPSDSTIQYLYETYPDQISPIDGVTDEHFKLYGKISGNFKNGNTITFSVSANYLVSSFSGGKALVISNLGQFGGKNPVSLMFALLFLSKQAISPRMVADPALLNWHS
eukprot:gene27824-36659_t